MEFKIFRVFLFLASDINIFAFCNGMLWGGGFPHFPIIDSPGID